MNVVFPSPDSPATLYGQYDQVPVMIRVAHHNSKCGTSFRNNFVSRSRKSTSNSAAVVSYGEANLPLIRELQ